MKNVVIEVVNCEDGVSVNKCGLGEWGYLWCVLSNNKNGEVEDIVLDEDKDGSLLELYKEVLEVEFDKYVENCKDSMYEIEDVEEIKKKLFEEFEKEFEEDEVMGVKVGGYCMEYDDQFVIIMMKLE